jgi:hypothetical protein
MKPIQTQGQVLLLVCFTVLFSLNMKASRENGMENDSLIAAYTSQVNADSVESYLNFLQSFDTRFMIAPNRREVAEAISDKFMELGADYTRIDSFSCYTNANLGSLKFDTITWQYNVIGGIAGMLDSEDYYIMGAHYDDVVWPQGDPMELAPGADDNASGVVALFETIRIFAKEDYLPMHSIEFVAFAAEELMYYGNSGAQAFVDTTLAHGKNMLFMINNDMIAYTADENWKINLSNYIGCETLTAIGEYVTDVFTEIEPELWEYTDQAGADAYYFYEAGVPTIYFMEEDFNPFYHTVNDLVENAVIDYCAEAIKISIGTIMMASDTVLTNLPTHQVGLDLLVYPNPSGGQLKIRGEHIINGPVLARVTDLHGRIVEEKYLDENQSINLKHCEDGIYLVHIYAEDQKVVKKIILAKN